MNKIIQCIKNVERFEIQDLKELFEPYKETFDKLQEMEKMEILLQIGSKIKLSIPSYKSITQRNVLFKASRKDEFSFLSNFWPHVMFPTIASTKYNLSTADMELKIGGKIFFSTEHYFQYKKYMIIDPDYANTIYATGNSRTVKFLSGKLKYIDWAKMKYNTSKAHIRRFNERMAIFRRTANLEMMIALYSKFIMYTKLKDALLSTFGLNIMEQGRMKRDYWAHTGENMLGKMLVHLRFCLGINPISPLDEYIESFSARFPEINIFKLKRLKVKVTFRTKE